MKPTNEVVAAVQDDGRFLPVALALARDLKKVYFVGPRQHDCPSVTLGTIGDGFEDQNLFRVDSIADVHGEIDLIVIPDVGRGSELEHHRGEGIPCWGPGRAETLETHRGKWLATLDQIGLPVPKYHRVEGLTNLYIHLRPLRDKWIKISKWRGNFETLHWRSWEEDEGTLDYYAVKFGPLKELITFYVFDPIEAIAEDGIDTHVVDGKLPKITIHAMERKDAGLLATIQPWEDVIEEIRDPMERLASILAAYGYRGPVSSEVRITEDHESFFTDPTLRYASPVSQVQVEMIGNFADIVWRGANGECVDPEPVAQFGVQAIVEIKGEPDQWDEILLPEGIRPWFKAGFAVQVGDKLCIPPGLASHALWLVSIGDTIQEALDRLAKLKEQLPDGLDCRYESIYPLLEEAKEAAKEGMPLTEEAVPEPKEVVEHA